MSFFCPCISWMQLPAGSEQLNSNDRNGDEEETTRNDKKQYHGLRLVGDADSEPVQFNMMRLKEDVVSDGTCKSPLLHMILNTKNVISNKIQQGKEIASDSITMVYNNSSSADIDREESSIKGTQNSERSGFDFISEKNREAECVICLVEFSEGMCESPRFEYSSESQ